jgi:hypothetical protein
MRAAVFIFSALMQTLRANVQSNSNSNRAPISMLNILYQTEIK